MITPELLIVHKNSVLHLTLNREARRNALSPSLIQSLQSQLKAAASNKDISSLCLSGAGDKSFCSGLDLKSSLEGDLSSLDFSMSYAELLQTLLAFPKPVVAQVNGHAMGGGLGLLLACDIAIARDDILLGSPEVKVGLFPMMISPLILQHMPRKRAMQMMLCGEKISSTEALAYGMLSHIVSPEKLESAIESVLQSLGEGAPLAQQLGKKAIIESANLPFHKRIDILSSHLKTLMDSEDAAEGMTAFFEKRKAIWKGC